MSWQSQYEHVNSSPDCSQLSPIFLPTFPGFLLPRNTTSADFFLPPMLLIGSYHVRPILPRSSDLTTFRSFLVFVLRQSIIRRLFCCVRHQIRSYHLCWLDHTTLRSYHDLTTISTYVSFFFVIVSVHWSSVVRFVVYAIKSIPSNHIFNHEQNKNNVCETCEPRI